MKEDEIISFPPPGLFGGHSPKQLQEGLKEKLRGRAEAAYLFGSMARGEGDYYSDIDLIIVKESSLPFHRRAFEFVDLFDVYDSLDILVYTPREFADLTNAPTVGFWTEVAAQARRLL